MSARWIRWPAVYVSHAAHSVGAARRAYDRIAPIQSIPVSESLSIPG